MIGSRRAEVKLVEDPFVPDNVSGEMGGVGISETAGSIGEVGADDESDDIVTRC